MLHVYMCFTVTNSNTMYELFAVLRPLGDSIEFLIISANKRV